MSQKTSYDVVVVGAGIVGLACGWQAAERGCSVLVVDRNRPGGGASGVAAGMLAPVTEADFGEDALLRLNLESSALWREFSEQLAERSGLQSTYEQRGALVVAVDRDDSQELQRLWAFQQTLGLGVEWLSGRGCRRLEGGLSPRVSGGLSSPQEAQVDPRAAVRALAVALERAGGELEAGVEASLATSGGVVAGVELSRSRVPGADTASTGEGTGAAPPAYGSADIAGLADGAAGTDWTTVAADAVVVATGAWTGELEGLAGEPPPPVRPVKGEIVRLRGPDAGRPLAERLVRTPRCYVVSRRDGEVVVGATVEERGFDSSVRGGAVFGLLEAAREVLPDVDELEWVEARAGLRPGTPDNAPAIGAGGTSGLVWAVGHHRNGVLLAPLTARAVVALLLGEEPPEIVRDFAPGRFRADRRDANGGSLPEWSIDASREPLGPTTSGRRG